MMRNPLGGVGSGMGPDDEIRQVEPQNWVDSVTAAMAQGHTWFDRLAAVDELGRDDVFRVVIRLVRWDDAGAPQGLQLHVRVPRSRPVLDTLTEVIAGASWHEREAHDFFGIEFSGGDEEPLLWHQQIDVEPVAPLRKDAILAARAAKPWPGSKDPSDAARASRSAASRRRMAPAGVPAPEVWGGRDLGAPASAEEVVQALSGGRVRRRR